MRRMPRDPRDPRLRAVGRLSAAVLLVLGAGVVRAECTTVDPAHAAWTRILAAHVEHGLVDYEGIAARDRGALDAYLATLAGTCLADYEAWPREARIAFWLNAYNAATVRLVLDEWPLESIRDVGWLPGAAFRRPVLVMRGLGRGRMSLDDVEHGTLRRDPALFDARIHFALVCAARSCPPLRSEAYRGDDLGAQLDDQGRRFLRDRTKNRWEPATRTLRLSRIFDWFREDFERAAGSPVAFAARYLPAKDAAAVEVGPVTVEHVDYDWSLNGR